MAEILDNDLLDMTGDWKITYRINVDASFTFPPAHSNTYGVRLVDAGVGSHGGRKFKGKYSDPPSLKADFEGETFYSRRGVQLVQMLVFNDGLRYLEVLSGKHVIDHTDLRKIWILGAWFNVGNPGNGEPHAGSGFPGVFEMVKVTTAKTK